MCHRASALFLLAAVLALGATPSAARAAEPADAQGMLGKAQSASEQQRIKQLLHRLESGKQPAAGPTPHLAENVADPNQPAATDALSQPLAVEKQATRSEPAPLFPAANVPAMQPAAAESPGPTGEAALVSASSGARAPLDMPGFMSPNGVGGQPVGRQPRQRPETGLPDAQAARVVPLPVAPGIHLSPSRQTIETLPFDPVDKAVNEAGIVGPGDTGRDASTLRTAIPQLPPLRPVAPSPSQATAVTIEPATRPPATVKRPPPAAASKRGQCTDILQRATLGELTEEDRTILRTQCR